LKLLSILAQTTNTAATTHPVEVPWYASQWIPLVLLGVIFYVFIFRAKKTQDKKRTSMLELLKPGDRVQTIGGILGTVIKASDSEVTLKVDETSNTKLRFARSAIHRVLGEEVETK
jgi:preprotein translocase subunit YajC